MTSDTTDIWKQGAAIFERWTRLWNGDLALAGELIADGFWVHLTLRNIAGPEQLRDAAAVARWVAAVRDRYGRLAYVADGPPFIDTAHRTVVCPWHADGVFAGRSGKPQDVPGQTFRQAGIDILRFEGDRVVECWTMSVDVTGLGEGWPQPRR